MAHQFPKYQRCLNRFAYNKFDEGLQCCNNAFVYTHMSCYSKEFRKYFLVLNNDRIISWMFCFLYFKEIHVFLQADDGWFSRKCRLINHSTGLLSFLMPSFLNFSITDEGLCSEILNLILKHKYDNIWCMIKIIDFYSLQFVYFSEMNTCSSTSTQHYPSLKGMVFSFRSSSSNSSGQLSEHCLYTLRKMHN